MLLDTVVSVCLGILDLVIEPEFEDPVFAKAGEQPDVAIAVD
jgi:hypothetical protein